jgi:hypothetical protein
MHGSPPSGGRLFILQYADDTFFMDHSLQPTRNVKLLLITFDQMSRLKIKFL